VGTAEVDAERTLARHRALLAAELARCRFTEAEATLLCEACNGAYWEPHSIALLWVEISDAIDSDALAAKWQLAGPGRTDADHFEAGAQLIAKLRALTPGQTFAVVDAVERFWAHPGRPLGERLRAVGLVCDPA
jgi:hypothetical protein